MNLICYLPAELPANHPLRRLVVHGLPQFTRQVYEALPGLERRLACPGEPGAILVLAPHDARALEDLVALGELCRSRLVVLILPEEQEALQRLGHRLRPRFMTCLHRAATELEAVLDRLANRSVDIGEVNPDSGGGVGLEAEVGGRKPWVGLVA